MIYIVSESAEYVKKAEKLANELVMAGVSCENKKVLENTELPSDAIKLVFKSEGLFLESEGQSMHGDFSKLKKRLMHNNLTHEMIVKVSKTKGVESPFAIDCTAGMGEDSVLLAGAGFRVTLFERDPVIAALLEDTIERAKADEELTEIANRMRLIKGDSILRLSEIKETADVIVLDPMFPERTKSSLVKKKFQLLHLLEQPCMDEEALLNAALGTTAHKIVIKRPIKGPYLAGIKPGYSLSGKTVRYDCIVRV